MDDLVTQVAEAAAKEGFLLDGLQCRKLARAIIPMIYEDAARVAEWSHMVLPDGGSPSEEEYEHAKRAAQSIRSRVLTLK